MTAKLGTSYGKRQRACGTRKKWYTKAEAKERAKQLRREGYTSIVAYACSYCGHYHVGHDRKKPLGPADIWERITNPAAPSWWPKNVPVGAPSNLDKA